MKSSLVNGFLANLPIAVIAIHWDDNCPTIEYKNDLAERMFSSCNSIEIMQHIFHIDGLPDSKYRKIIFSKFFDISKSRFESYEIYTLSDTNELVPKNELDQALRNSRDDQLTGLLNRRGIDHALTNLREEMVNQCRATKRAEDHEAKKEIAVCMLDLDRFKLVNDTYGHEIGDDVLRTLASIIRHCTRPNDIIGRDGGDEFRIILKVNSVMEAKEIINRIVEKMALFRFGDNDNCTVSAGIVMLPFDNLTIEKIDEARKIADKAMYESKEGGRNKVTII